MPAAESRRRGTSKKVALGGGCILALGILMGMYMKIPGWGGGTMVSTSTGDQTETASSSNSDQTDNNLPTAGLITVLIDDRAYSIAKADGDNIVYTPTAIAAIVQQAQQVPGNEDGIKVRVLRKESARATAESNLRNALVDAGIDAGAIYMPRSFVQ